MGRGPRLVLAHGFTQNARCWGPFANDLAADHQVVPVDLPGHGRTDPEHDDADLVVAGRLLVETGGEGIYVGYSMGGRMLLHKALSDQVGEIRSLILIGATAGIESDAERAERKAQDHARAARILEIGTPAFIEEWLAQPMFAGLTDEQSSKIKRFENAADGLAASLRNCGTGSQESLWPYLSSLRMPVLIIAGSRDEKYTEIGQRMLAAIGSNARFVNIDGGHAVHLENPEVTAAVISSWGEQLS